MDGLQSISTSMQCHSYSYFLPIMALKVHFRTFTNPTKAPSVEPNEYFTPPHSHPQQFSWTYILLSYSHPHLVLPFRLFVSHYETEYVYDLAIHLTRATRFIRYILLHSITLTNFDEENFEIPYYIFFIDHHVTSSDSCPNIILLSCSQNLEF